MIKKIVKFLGQKPDESKTDFFNLSSKEQKKIINKAAREANQEQFDLVENYKNKFKGLETNHCKI